MWLIRKLLAHMPRPYLYEVQKELSARMKRDFLQRNRYDCICPVCFTWQGELKHESMQAVEYKEATVVICGRCRLPFELEPYGIGTDSVIMRDSFVELSPRKDPAYIALSSGMEPKDTGD